MARQRLGPKTIDDFFADWESHVIGFGYGTGEPHTMRALKSFFDATKPPQGTYDYEELEAACTPAVAWLLISVLARADVVDYGTSPRHGLLTANGRALADYIRARSVDQLLAAADRDEDYVECFPDYCNCGDNNCRNVNPFWPKTRG